MALMYRSAFLFSNRRTIPTMFGVGARSLSTSSTPPPFDLSTFGNVTGGTAITAQSLSTFKAWHGALNRVMHEGASASEVSEKLRSHVHDQAQFFPPTYFAHWQGGDELCLLLGAVSEVFGKSFVYKRQWLSDDGKNWCLEFDATINGDAKNVLNGVDLITLDDEGKIVDMKVLARPPNAVSALKAVMMAKVPPRLAVLKAKQAMGSFFK